MSAGPGATRHRFADVNGRQVFYREAGDPGRPAVVLLHGAPASSFMYRNYVEGFVTSFWEPLWAYAADPNPDTEHPIRDGLTLEAIRWQYTHGEPDPDLISPDAWHHDHSVLQRPGDLAAQLTLLRLYGTNVALYPAVHEWLRSTAVPVLAVWGRNDRIFGPAGAEAFRADVPDVRLELLDGGHFLLEAHVEEVAAIVLDFLGRHRESLRTQKAQS